MYVFAINITIITSESHFKDFKLENTNFLSQCDKAYSGHSTHTIRNRQESSFRKVFNHNGHSIKYLQISLPALEYGHYGLLQVEKQEVRRIFNSN